MICCETIGSAQHKLLARSRAVYIRAGREAIHYLLAGAMLREGPPSAGRQADIRKTLRCTVVYADYLRICYGSLPPFRAWLKADMEQLRPRAHLRDGHKDGTTGIDAAASRQRNTAHGAIARSEPKTNKST
jgi:hypothetical protein